MNHAAAAPCWHCGLPVTTGDRFSAEIEGDTRRFCCPACLTVAETIVAGGLGSYYRYREGSGLRPEAAPDPSAAYDDPDLQQRFVRRDGDTATVTLLIGGIHCAACVWLLENYLGQLPGVAQVSVSQSEERAVIQWRPAETKLSELFAAIARIGYEPQLYSGEKLRELQQREQHRALRRLGVAGIGMMQVGMFAVALYAAGEDGMALEHRQLLRWVSLLVAIPVVFYAARPFFAGAWRGLKTRQPGMDLPVAVAIGLAFAASTWATVTGGGEVYFDSVAMFTFLLLGSRYLEQRARHFARRQQTDLQSLLPTTATLLGPSGEPQSVPSFKLKPGDRVLVRPGQTLPADGTVIEGRSALSTAHLTGEFLPRPVAPGDSVVAGSVNGDSPLTLAVSATGADLQLNNIDELLQRAQASKPRLAQMADRIATRFVLAVLTLATATYLGWLWYRPEDAFWVALAVLVVSCPCALSLATPAALTAAANRMRQLGLLVCNGRVWEQLPTITDVVCDKTGTLTEGRLAIARVEALAAVPAADCLAWAASLETVSEHPVARAFREREPTASAARAIETVTGQGLEGVVDGRRLRLGRPAYAAALAGIEAPSPPADGESWVLLADEQQALCWFQLLDRPRAEAAGFIGALRERGLAVHLLTGDSRPAATRLAAGLGIERITADASPAGKLAYIQRLQADGARVLMVGDGINDIPVMAAADVSVAMAEASDLAKTSADGILLAGRLNEIEHLLDLAARTRRTIRQNLAWALSYNLLAIPLAALGWIPPWLAAVGMSASSLVVVANALRLQRRTRGPAASPTGAPQLAKEGS